LSDDPLRGLAKSTQAFYERFNVIPDPEDVIKVFEEEVRELIEAVRLRHDALHIGEEAADVMVTVLGVCYAAGLNIEDLIVQIEAVIRKNDAKTQDTHAQIDGKIRRKN
jgi:NTP pyrophosphatase (non-canonical NTP hydrolase)